MKNSKQIIPGTVFLLYLAIYIYAAVFNWEIFTTVLNIELGFAKVAMLPFLVFFILGLITIMALWFLGYKRDLNHHIRFLEKAAKVTELQKDVEIEKLKVKGTFQKPEALPIEKVDTADQKVKPDLTEVSSEKNNL
ncbi:MAG: hypothetical protein U9N86_07830 [Bacteroidota bacterium]|nr:hypothetical protein [Bacteroidota bacterium]